MKKQGRFGRTKIIIESDADFAVYGQLRSKGLTPEQALDRIAFGKKVKRTDLSLFGAQYK